MVLEPGWNPKNPCVPIDINGNWKSYPVGVSSWERVVPFKARMKVTGMEVGRSSKLFILQDLETERRYPMFVSDFVEIMKNALVTPYVESGTIVLETTWTASKRGANYGLKVYR